MQSDLCALCFCLGASNPVRPIDIVHTTLSSELAVIQWLVPQVSYTPETYVIIYGTDSMTLNYTSERIIGNTDVTAMNQIYTATLRGLQPNTRYYYQVVATNSIGMNSSVVAEVVTPLPGIIMQYKCISVCTCVYCMHVNV